MNQSRSFPRWYTEADPTHSSQRQWLNFPWIGLYIFFWFIACISIILIGISLILISLFWKFQLKSHLFLEACSFIKLEKRSLKSHMVCLHHLWYQGPWQISLHLFTYMLHQRRQTRSFLEGKTCVLLLISPQIQIPPHHGRWTRSLLGEHMFWIGLRNGTYLKQWQ